MNLSSRSKAILICGAVILSVSLGVRHTFGLFLQPIVMEQGWGREVFAFAIAIQNLVWGIAQPFAGLAADRRGAGPVILVGGLLFASGVGLMSVAGSIPIFVIAAGILVGLGLSGTTMPVVFGAISRAMPPEKRSMAFGIAMSVGSLGQFILLPGALGLIDHVGWAYSLMLLSALSAVILPLSFALRENRKDQVGTTNLEAHRAARLALGDRGFQLLSFGFFVCGFHVVFIAIHIPVYLLDAGLSSTVGSTVLALIGLFNIFGSLAAGWLGGRFPKPQLLSFLYLARAATIAAFVLLPPTPTSAYVFAMLMGFLWLSTVPLTNGIVASMFGVTNMAMLGGVIFLAHQIGSFLGGWLGGAIYDRFGSYDIVWAVAIGLSLVAAAVNWPIAERPVMKAVAT
ncbi:major facilitator superfamily MFS_1 [Afipia carboxidovorans OM5]|uniref:MFS transporter protein n=1 Tax=Afipia carboxidovorans (strain ATCC 49405 / DSM 1227 / KCTC 32145 / OM5) TaxID=504832 RepID=B6JBS8_AFIC5|nr:MFS transporter [Afipia carboxidovorans]ACI92144.1 major facilitator superfamily MFS_1 [Afipia carboxidovorans OM5]AEI07640.1 MFS transporter protein [Afipia carboxidovorans OM5]